MIAAGQVEVFKHLNTTLRSNIVRNKKWSLAKICRLISWVSAITAIVLMLAVMGYTSWLFVQAGRGVSRVSIEYTANAFLILSGIFTIARFVLCMLPPLKLKQDGGSTLQPDRLSILLAYQWAIRQAQIMGLLLGISGGIIRYDAGLGLLVLIGVSVISWRYLRHPLRRQLTAVNPFLKSRVQTLIRISIQGMFLFALMLVLCCASVATDGLIKMLNNPILCFLAAFGGIGFYGQFRIRRELESEEIIV